MYGDLLAFAKLFLINNTSESIALVNKHWKFGLVSNHHRKEINSEAIEITDTFSIIEIPSQMISSQLD